VTARRILVIKLGALGDFVQALGPFAAIRRHHAGDRITLLTTRLYAPLAQSSGYFDDIWIDDRPPWWRAWSWLALKRRLDGGGFRRVYDLQTSRRSGRYFALLGRPKPEWNGVARGCSHPHANPGRNAMHSIERQREQLGAAGIANVPPPDLSWIDGDAGAFGLEPGFVLLAPGGSAHRPAKRWPLDDYASLARALAGRGRQPVLIGAGDEAARNAAIARACPAAIDLTGRTDLADIARLARAAAGAVGNDNGPMHLIAAAGCPSVVLFSAASDPALCAQRGPSVAILRRDDLSTLALDEVEAAMRLR
jgi:ADP-heptose:LPS heptosyltransferase